MREVSVSRGSRACGLVHQFSDWVTKTDALDECATPLVLAGATDTKLWEYLEPYPQQAETVIPLFRVAQ